MIVNTGFLYATNEIIIYTVFFALMLAAAEAGFYLGRMSGAGIPKKLSHRFLLSRPRYLEFEGPDELG
jgi:membrane protein DedA with SNARE-associated domain